MQRDTEENHVPLMCGLNVWMILEICWLLAGLPMLAGLGDWLLIGWAVVDGLGCLLGFWGFLAVVVSVSG